jgi:peptide/nickel transport system permease protein
MFAYIVRRILYAFPILIGVNALTFALFFRKERGDFNAATLRSKVDELEELNDMAEEEAEGEEPRYTDSLVPWPVGS